MIRQRHHPRDLLASRRRTRRPAPGTTPWRARGRFARVAVLLLLLLLLGGLTQGALGPPAVATTPATDRSGSLSALRNKVSVQIESVSPTTLTPTGTLVVQGRVTNDGADPINGVFVRLLYRYKPLETRAELQKWASGDPNLTNTVNEPNPKTTRVVFPEPVSGHSSRPFRFSVEAKELNLPVLTSVFGTRGLMVDAFARRPSRGTEQIAAAYTFLVWNPRPAQRYTKLTVLAPITFAQAQPDASEPTDALISSMASGGRLNRLISTVRNSGIDWAIDPSLFEAAQQAQAPTGNPAPFTPSSASPSLVPRTVTPRTVTPRTVTPRTTSGSDGPTADTGSPARTLALPTTGNSTENGIGPSDLAAPHTTTTTTGATGIIPEVRATAAKAWLDAVTGTAATNRPLVLPFADPDLTALAHNDGGGLLDLARKQADSTARQVLGPDLKSSIAWPVGGQADISTANMLTEPTWQGIVLSDSAQPPATTQQTTTSGRSAVPRAGTPLASLLSDSTLSGLLGDLGTPQTTQAQAALIQQRLLAELATITVERPDEARHLLVTAPRDWDPNPAVVSRVLTEVSRAPWAQLQSVDSLLSDHPSPVRQTELQYPSRARSAELPEPTVRAVIDSQASVEEFAPVLTKPQELLPGLQRQAVSLVGAAWRGHSLAELAAARAPWQARVRRVLNSVTVLSGDANLLSHSGRLPITVHNDLDQPVHVQLLVKPRSLLLRLGNRKPFAIGPHGNHTVVIPFRAAGNGKVQVEATLWSSPPGPEPVFRAPFEVRVHSNWESTGLIVAGTLLGVLVLFGLARSIRRGRTPLPPESAPDPDELMARRESRQRTSSILGRLFGEDDQTPPGPGPGEGPDPTVRNNPSGGDEPTGGGGPAGATATDPADDQPVRRTP